ncbi:type II secretion system F family protein [Gordonibacter sp.]|uniref:type II secretion system F family protein n=1 Tax=Gordonibacter sp. TaxID=1968902 RepID=UPI002FCC6136
MVYLVISTAIVVVCMFLCAEVLAHVRADRLAQRSRIVTGIGADAVRVSPDKDARASVGRGAGLSWEAARSPMKRRDTPLARRLRASGIDIDPALWVGAVVGFDLLFAVFSVVVSGTPLLGVVGAAVVLAALHLFVKRRTRKRAELFDVQLAQALPRIAASVRGALTLERALRVAVIHMEDPLREEFARVLSDAACGMPLHEALSAMAARTQSDDVRTLANATKVRHGSGGSVSAVLSMISSRVDARLKAACELKVEIAGTRMAKWFVAAAMPVLFLIMYVTNAGFARFYVEEPLGWTVLGVAAVMEVAGLLASHGITSVGRP